MKPPKRVLIIQKIALRVLGWGFLLTALFAGGFIVSSISELRLKLEEASLAPNKAELGKPSLLEEGSRLLQSDWKEFEIFLEAKYESEKIVRGGYNYYLVDEDITLPKVLVNDCQRVYCLQFKKNFSEIPPFIWKALLGTEDSRFLDHKGVDPKAITRAIIVDLIAMKFVQGGSTLTQQLVKNLFLSNEKTLIRKLKELVYALYIEQKYSKEMILSLYLNEVFWGSFQGIYLKGFHSASLAYFNKPPDELSEFESTILISFLKGPNYYTPRKSFKAIKQRSESVFKRLQKIGVFSEEIKKWTEEEWTSWREEFLERNSLNHFRTFYRLGQTENSLLEDYEHFVLIKHSLDHLEKFKEKIKGKGDLAIKIYIGDIHCDVINCESDLWYYSKPERNLEKAIKDEFHQVGSLLKPMIYDLFVEEGREWDELVSTDPITLKLLSGNWSPKDYSKVKVPEISIKESLQKSKNIPLIRLAEEVGFEKIENKLLGYIPKLKTPLKEYPAQLLGAVELSLFEMFNVYKKFLSKKCSQIIEDGVKYEESVLGHMSDAKATTISKLVRGELKENYLFGKTGTSNKGRDNWYLSFDGRRIYLIWVGSEGPNTGEELYLTGGGTSFRIFQSYLINRGKLAPETYCVSKD